jgi:N-acetylglucosamine kinase-like BadF-type ATPase
MQALLDHYGGRDENEGMPDELMDYFNEAQNSIDRWIKEGGIKQVASPSPQAVLRA